MPFQSGKGNNRVLPANNRAVDVAKQALTDLIPLQQKKYANAFEVMGYETLVYNRMTQGQICSCQSSRKVFTTLLQEDGKMPEGKINEMLTGGLEFTVNPYGARNPGRQDLRAIRGAPPLIRQDQIYGELLDESQNQPPFDHSSPDLSDPYTNSTSADGINGPNQQGMDLDDFVENFDTNLDVSSSKCGACYGTGFVGGYTLLNGWRLTLVPNLPEIVEVDGTIEGNIVPFAFYAKRVQMEFVLPKGYVCLDSFKVWNNLTMVFPDSITIDGLDYSQQLLAAFCDGRMHTVEVHFDELTYWTHLEIQIGLSDTPALIEFPRLNKSSNTSLQDLTDEVQINASPVIPRLTTRDVLVESTFGKAFLIESSNFWNDNKRNVLGWDCQARVLQPTEMLSKLPRRKVLKQRTTNPSRGNMNTGNNRT